jgi:hypothetical protein
VGWFVAIFIKLLNISAWDSLLLFSSPKGLEPV